MSTIITNLQGLNLNGFGAVGLVFCNRFCQCPPITKLRHFIISQSYMKNNYLGREGKFITKLIAAPKKKKKLYFEDSVPVPNGKGPKMGYHGGKENSRRMAVLNSVFMKHISDLLMTGEMSNNILDKNFEISRVAIAPSFAELNVFWSTNTEENVKALEDILPRVGYSLRHELSQLRIIGNVPRINFVKDIHLQSAMKVDHLLSIADYGEDHVPLHIKSEFKSGTDIENTVVVGKPESSAPDKDSSGRPVEGIPTPEDTSPSETMPQMRQDIFNLNHEQIFNKITKSLKKSRALHRFQPNLAVSCDGVDSSSSSAALTEDLLSREERKAAMAKFILTRRVLMEKRSQNKYNAELNVGPSEVEESNEDIDYDNFKPDDYIVEDYYEEEQKYNQ